jgi:hypothetical protein
MVIDAPGDKAISLLDTFGVAIKAIDSNQRHVGMLYRVDAGVRLCHLAFHLDLRDEPAGTSYFWAEAGLDAANRRFMAAQCARLAEGADKIPYGLREQGLCFDRTTGRYVPQPAGAGLTCATFIVVFLKAFGYHLLEEDTWPNRDDDTEWQRVIIQRVQAAGASQEHIDGMTKDLGAKRYRPEEVAGAVTRSEYPVTFAEASALAAEILAILYASRSN